MDRRGAEPHRHRTRLERGANETSDFSETETTIGGEWEQGRGRGEGGGDARGGESKRGEGGTGRGGETVCIGAVNHAARVG